MDPVGLSSSIISLIQAVKVIVDYLKDVHDAPRDRMDLLESLAGLQMVLESLRARFITNPQQHSSLETTRQLAAPNGPFEHLNTLLARLETKLCPALAGRDRLVQRLTWSFDKSDVKDSLSRLERLKSLVLLALQNDHLALSLAIQEDVKGVEQSVDDLSTVLQHEVQTVNENVTEMSQRVLQIDAGIERIDAGVEKLQSYNSLMQKGKTDVKHSEFAEWICPLNFRAVQDEILLARTPGTGNWLLENEQFRGWIEGGSKLLWCRGGPGVGKTVLASIIVNHLQDLHQMTPDICVVSIYCNYRQQSEQTSSALIGSILKQLVEHRSCLSEHLAAMQEKLTPRKSRPSLSELMDALKTELELFNRVFLIVDAFDECSDSDGTRGEVLSSLLSLPASVHLLITSRDMLSIAQEFDGHSILEVSADTDDLRTYIGQRIKNDGRLKRLIKGDERLQEEIPVEVIAKADGMFLLARLHMDSLASKHTRKALLAALRTLPKEIHNSYHDTMSRIRAQTEDDRDLAFQVFSWLTYAQRPLKVRELQHALAVSPEMTEMDTDGVVDVDILTSVCAGLVIIEPDSDIIHLVHYTTQEYFEQQREFLFPEAQYMIAVACITYLSFELPHSETEVFWLEDNSSNFDFDTCIDYRYPFLAYSARYWGDHTRGLEARTFEYALPFLQSIIKVNCAFRAGWSNYLKHTHLWNHHSPAYPDVMSIHLLAISGLARTIELLILREETNVDIPDSFGCTPLLYAIQQKHTDTAALLLEKSPTSARHKNKFGSTPLSIASACGAETMVQELLSQPGIDIDVADIHGFTALARCILENSVNSAKISSILLEHGASTSIMDTRQRTPLFIAARLGQEATVKLLMNHDSALGSLINQPGLGSRQTPLMAAVKSQHRGTTALLVQHPDCSAEIVNLLLKHKDIDLDVATGSGSTPLREAIRRGHESILRLLLQHGANPNQSDKASETPLHAAACQGNVLILVDLLMSYKIVADAKDHSGRTALSMAATVGTEEVVEILIQRNDVDPDSKDKRSRTPLSYASEKGHLGVVELLLQNGRVNVNVKDTLRRTPLSYVAEYGDIGIVEVLLESENIDSDLPDFSGMTPLLYSVRGCHLPVIDLLLEHNALV
ncbi:ankyrin repeat-containing domain protein, partial [Mycena floridula]